MGFFLQLAYEVHDILLLLRGGMDINIHGDLHAAVPEDLAEAFYIAAELHAAAGEGMAEKMEMEGFNPAFFQDRAEAVLKRAHL